MLALSDKNGTVQASVPGLATMSRLTLTETEIALERLHSPDKYSRSKEHEGRRIETVDGGWLILNHAKYRDQMCSEERREYLRIKQQEHRARKGDTSTDVNTSQQESTKSTHTATATAPTATPATKKNSAKAAISKEDSEIEKVKKENHVEFIKLWCQEYQIAFGIKYAFQSGKDGNAIKLLLSSTGRTPENLMRVFKAAWENQTGFFCKSAASICGFNSKFNEIVGELNTKHGKIKKSESDYSDWNS